MFELRVEGKVLIKGLNWNNLYYYNIKLKQNQIKLEEQVEDQAVNLILCLVCLRHTR